MPNHSDDPTTKYHTGGFPKQEQDQPGLTEATTPRPDHGEATYRGTGKLTGWRALITGGDSGIGRAVAIAYAREGADVAISYLPEEQKDAEDTAELIRATGRAVLLVRPGLQDQSLCHTVDRAHSDSAPLAGSIDHLHLVDSSIEPLAGIDRLRHDQGRTRRIHPGARPTAWPGWGAGQRRRARTDLDPINSPWPISAPWMSPSPQRGRLSQPPRSRSTTARRPAPQENCSRRVCAELSRAR